MTLRKSEIWIMAGEASGDLYGAALGKELQRRGAAAGCEVTIGGMGGPAMLKAGYQLTVDSTELGVVGILEVVKHLIPFIGLFFRLVREVRRRRPDAVVLIDYPTFNLCFARVLHRYGIPAIWYVSPHVWVWGKGRIRKLAKLCCKMLVIFPFEPEVYASSGLPTEFVGHPLVDMVEARRDPAIVRDPNLVVLLPGSRGMEISRLMEPMLRTVAELVKKHPALRFVLSAPRERIAERCRAMIGQFRQRNPQLALPEIPVETGSTARYQQQAGTGLAASGTVTVESAIAGLPLVVVYRLNWITLLLAALLVRLYRGAFTMVNIIAGKCVFEEFLQHHVCPAELVPALERILPGGERRMQVEADMRAVTNQLRAAVPEGKAAIPAVGRAAESVLQTIAEKHGWDAGHALPEAPKEENR